ncbi:4Fe-4S dicluster domain-containing protein [Shewanella gelidimarina]|uniref:4Fe-4S dicluster domain-containing protein n=1 Tax=Shewanella gelidimarina TaxID=56813 RepID=UPI0020103A6C|nr:4Fe-4S dicluster domain-containing protein [Shewanella gelidimarina]MCL1058576.1 4Fe-4S dicluster domain-containing protein [Shewanella gelidimarina]
MSEQSKQPLMDRRRFFKSSFSKIADIGSAHAQKKAEQNAKGWIRPPFAINELDFLLNCSRCGECIDACPQQVIFKLPLHSGATAMSTPAMDIPNKACELCSGWPCVTACKDKALAFPAASQQSQQQQEQGLQQQTQVDAETLIDRYPTANECPPMASAIINTSQCMPYSGPECGACHGSCPIEETLTWHNEQPSINVDTCIGCGQCVQACITEPKAIEISYFAPLDEQTTHEDNQ